MPKDCDCDNYLVELKALVEAFKRYRIFEEDGQYCVYDVAEDGTRKKRVGCHDTRDDAEGQIAAIGMGKSALSDCVSEKVRVYIRQGCDRDQALARAYAECCF
jgi:hypothetical protein